MEGEACNGNEGRLSESNESNDAGITFGIHPFLRPQMWNQSFWIFSYESYFRLISPLTLVLRAPFFPSLLNAGNIILASFLPASCLATAISPCAPFLGSQSPSFEYEHEYSAYNYDEFFAFIFGYYAALLF